MKCCSKDVEQNKVIIKDEESSIFLIDTTEVIGIAKASITYYSNKAENMEHATLIAFRNAAFNIALPIDQVIEVLFPDGIQVIDFSKQE